MKKMLMFSKKIYNFFKDTDWEYKLAFFFVYIKYRNFRERNKALRYIKMGFFERNFSSIVDEYRSNKFENNVNTGPIWFCWLQGKENMPPIVSLCYNRLIKMAPKGRDVIFLHWKNLNQYVHIPEYIERKVKQGVITYTHFSDILRFALLAEHGGLWIDSTVYVASPIPERIFEGEYYSARTTFDSNYPGVNRCLWKCFLLGAAPNSLWFSCARDIIYAYWKEMDYFIDYLIVDYILLLIYDRNHDIKFAVDSHTELDSYILKFEKIAGEEYSSPTYEKMCSESRWFKLTYKSSFRGYTNDGRLTYFGYLISEK